MENIQPPPELKLLSKQELEPLTTAQRSLAAIRAQEQYEAETGNSLSVALGGGRVREKLGFLFGLGPFAVAQAKWVLGKATPQVVAALEAGRISLYMAKEIASLPESEQAAAIVIGESKSRPARKKRARRVQSSKPPATASAETKKSVRAAVGNLSRTLDVVGLRDKYQEALDSILSDIKRK